MYTRQINSAHAHSELKLLNLFAPYIFRMRSRPRASRTPGYALKILHVRVIFAYVLSISRVSYTYPRTGYRKNVRWDSRVCNGYRGVELIGLGPGYGNDPGG